MNLKTEIFLVSIFRGEKRIHSILHLFTPFFFYILIPFLNFKVSLNEIGNDRIRDSD